MDIKSKLFKIKLKLIDAKILLKKSPALIYQAAKDFDIHTLKKMSIASVYGLKKFFLQTPLNLSLWNLNSFSGICRYILFSFLLCFIFAFCSTEYAFIANDGFISFRYVENAILGNGFVFNPAPFEPLSGFTSFLWLFLLKLMWQMEIEPPFSANLLTFAFSMGIVAFGFAFIKRMQIQERMKKSSLFFFLLFCLILLLNPTFMGFMTSGTEAALFNFLVVWWTFEVTREENKNPVFLATSAIAITLTRSEGLIFLPTTLLLLTFYVFQRNSLFKRVISLLSLLSLGSLWFYFNWLKETYGSPLLHSFINLYKESFPDFGRDYILSFVLEYALYYWIPFFVIWSLFKFVLRRKQGFFTLILLLITFLSYLGYFLFVIGGDALEYRPLGFFIPLLVLAGIKMLAENICAKARTVAIFLLLYLMISTAIPSAQEDIEKDLDSRQETAFLYKPIAEKANLFAFFEERFDMARKKIVYQGVGLRLKEHKVLTDIQLKSFPTRQEGLKIKKEQNLLFAWSFVGVAGWVLPNIVIIDSSGQNNFIASQSPFKYEKHRLFGHERTVPEGYISCFNGGSSLQINPFLGKKNLKFLPTITHLTDGKILSCEDFWRIQVDPTVEDARSLYFKLR